MRIAVLSDVHDNIWALQEALRLAAGADALLGLGDYCAPFTVAAIGDGFAGPVHLVWGNNDGDRVAIARVASQYPQMTVHGDWAKLELGGQAVAMVHSPDLGRALGEGGRFDLVCHGHDHRRNSITLGRTLLLNPGEVMGRFGAHSIAIYDAKAHTAEIVVF